MYIEDICPLSVLQLLPYTIYEVVTCVQMTRQLDIPDTAFVEMRHKCD